MTEEWRAIEGYEGLYEVSNFARVRKLKRWKGVYGHIMTACSGPHGYLQIGLRKGKGTRKHHYLHILVAKAFVPNPNALPEVNHDDGDKTNCLPNNLYWTTRSGNNIHKNRVLLSHHNQQDYTFLSPNGVIYYIRNLKEFCELNGLTPSAMSRVYLGKRLHHKGWKRYENTTGMAGTRTRTA